MVLCAETAGAWQTCEADPDPDPQACSAPVDLMDFLSRAALWPLNVVLVQNMA